MSVGHAIWNVCVTHAVGNAGLYRAINDFATALDAPVLSFDEVPLPADEGHAAQVHRVRCRSWLGGCRLMPAAAGRQAESIVGDARLLIAHSLFRGHVPWAHDWATARARRSWVVPHGCLDPWGFVRRGGAKRIWLATQGRRCFRDAERVICATRRERDKAAPWLGSARSCVLHWPVPTPDLSPRAAARAAFRRRLAIPEGDRILLAAARLHTMKRPLETIRWFCEAGVSGCHLVLAGMDGDLSHSMVAASVPPACRDRVHVVGHLDSPALEMAYLASDGFIALSFRENFGYGIAAAVAAGLPLIASPGHDLTADMPGDGGRGLCCGWLLPDDSRQAAIDALRDFATASPSRLIDMGDAGRHWAEDALSPERFRAQLRGWAG